ncbi:Gfo/Idh/MocA family oxidoreductase [Microbacterium sp. NPDC089320]|uniref:Gfo/Idh/MocA family protein n=1 Tax=Microbacterium sp. NPDC089320 TaxID=3155182 RepID=UPI003423F0E5
MGPSVADDRRDGVCTGRQQGGDGSRVHDPDRGPDRSRRQPPADIESVAVATGDPQRIWADPRIDAVYIATPNATHEAWIDLAVRHGRHVLVEKPAVLSSERFTELWRHADADGLVLLEAIRTVPDPGFGLVRRALDGLGTLRRASFVLCRRSSRYDRVLAGERPGVFDPAGGGALRDIGVYPLTAMVELFGRPRSVQALSSTIATGADGAGSLLLDYGTLIGEVAYSKVDDSPRGSEIQGDDATLLIDAVDQPRRLTVRRHGGSERTTVVDLPPFDLRPVVGRFVDLVRGRADPHVDRDRTAAVLAIIEHALCDR